MENSSITDVFIQLIVFLLQNVGEILSFHSNF